MDDECIWERREARLPKRFLSASRFSHHFRRFSTHCVAATSRRQFGHLYSRTSTPMTASTHSVIVTSSYSTFPSASFPFSRAATGTLSTSCASTRYRTLAHAVHCRRCSSAKAKVSVGSGQASRHHYLRCRHHHFHRAVGRARSAGAM